MNFNTGATSPSGQASSTHPSAPVVSLILAGSRRCPRTDRREGWSQRALNWLRVGDDAIGDLGTAAALARSYAEDSHGFLGALAGLLEGVMPESTEVERKPLHLMSSKKRVVGLCVDLGDFVYSLHETPRAGVLEARRAKIVRGVTLKTESLPIPLWLEGLSARLSEKARSSEDAFYALKEFLKQ